MSNYKIKKLSSDNYAVVRTAKKTADWHIVATFALISTAANYIKKLEA